MYVCLYCKASIRVSDLTLTWPKARRAAASLMKGACVTHSWKAAPKGVTAHKKSFLLWLTNNTTVIKV